MSGETPETKRGNRKERVGRVVSDAADKTIVVAVDRRVRHPLYGKIQRKTAKFHAHDEANAAKIGDTVRIVETRPLSRLKCWRLLDIVARGERETAT
ncbi:MAG: 30S ribosomal protein S17 [Kiritimatiellia bacterium]|nr:30S ribosomal protein S17 [Kiritimatiellia bacterium]